MALHFANSSQLLHVLSHVHDDIPTAIDLCAKELQPLAALRDWLAQVKLQANLAQMCGDESEDFDVALAEAAVNEAGVTLRRLQSAIASIAHAALDGHAGAQEKVRLLVSKRSEAAGLLLEAQRSIAAATDKASERALWLLSATQRLEGLQARLPRTDVIPGEPQDPCAVVAKGIKAVYTRAESAVVKFESLCGTMAASTAQWRRLQALDAEEQAVVLGEGPKHLQAAQADVEKRCKDLEAALGLLFRFGPGAMSPRREPPNWPEGSTDVQGLDSSVGLLLETLSTSCSELVATEASHWISHQLAEALSTARKAMDWVSEEHVMLLRAHAAAAKTVRIFNAELLEAVDSEQLIITARHRLDTLLQSPVGHQERCFAAAEVVHMAWVCGVFPEAKPLWLKVVIPTTQQQRDAWLALLFRGIDFNNAGGSDESLTADDAVPFLGNRDLFGASCDAFAQQPWASIPTHHLCQGLSALLFCDLLAALTPVALQRHRIVITPFAVCLTQETLKTLAAPRPEAVLPYVHVAAMIAGDMTGRTEADICDVLKRLQVFSLEDFKFSRVAQVVLEEESPTLLVQARVTELCTQDSTPQLELAMIASAAVEKGVPLTAWPKLFRSVSAETCGATPVKPSTPPPQTMDLLATPPPQPVTPSRSTTWKRVSDETTPPPWSPSVESVRPALSNKSVNDRAPRLQAFLLSDLECKALREALVASVHCGPRRIKSLVAFRVSNPILQHAFTSRLQSMRMLHDEHRIQPVPEVLDNGAKDATDRGSCSTETYAFDSLAAPVLGRTPLDWDFANPVLLLHGTSCKAAFEILRDGFDERVASAGPDNLFGSGTYLTNALCKAHKYSQPATTKEDVFAFNSVSETARRSASTSEQLGGINTPSPLGMRCVIIARALLGRAHITTNPLKGLRRPPADGSNGLRCDCVIGNGKHHKEFVVYDRGQLLPEAVVWYALDDCTPPSH